jgi:hypothetical protein
METIVSELLSSHPELNPPRVYLIEGAPELRTGVEDLVYWWHLSVAKFSHLKNEARIDLLKVGEEKEGFERRKFREVGVFAFAGRAGRQSVVHVWAEPGCNAQYGTGFILVVGWNEEGTLSVLERVRTGRGE